MDARALQGAGAAAMVPQDLGVLTQADLFGLGWRPIFLINLPIGIATVVLGLRFLPESRDGTAGRLDPPGMFRGV